MIFNLKRTSDWGADKKPHERAYMIGQTEILTIVNGKETDKKIKATNWGIELNSLEELLAFRAECGYELIICPGDSEVTLEIYDGYRD